MLCRQADCSWFKSPTGELALKDIHYLDIERFRQLNYTENFNSLREGIEYYCKYIELTCMSIFFYNSLKLSIIACVAQLNLQVYSSKCWLMTFQ